MSGTSKQIAVLDRGFVYVGDVSIADGFVTVTGAKCIRRWGTNHGLGELARLGPRPQTVLDDTGTVRAPLSSLMHTIDCDPAKWA